MSRIVDLSQEIYQGMPVHPRHLKTCIFPNLTRDEYVAAVGYPFFTRNLLLNEHGPTHSDAIAEYSAAGPTIDQMAMRFFYGEAIALDLRSVSPDGAIEVHDLELALRRYGASTRPPERVLLCTGHHRRAYGAPEYLTRYAGLTREAAEWLADRGVINIGIDAPSIDGPGDPAFSGHVVCAERGITNTEHLCNLEEVVDRRFLYIGLPLRIRGGTGSPIRAIAVLDEAG